VKIIRNYNSENKEIQDHVKATIQPDVSFFDLGVDIKKDDYVIVPNSEEPLIVERVKVYDGLPPRHIEAVLIPESKFLEKNRNFDVNIDQVSQEKSEDLLNKNSALPNFTAHDYLHALENVITDSNIPQNDKNNLIQKIQEIKDNPYIKNLSTRAVVDIKQIIFQ